MLFLPLNISFDFEYYPLLIVASIAVLVPFLLSSLRIQRIPGVIIEIIAGYLVGKFLLNDLPAQHLQSLDFLALSGFMFLMFLSGLEIDVDQIRQSLPKRKITGRTIQENPLLIGVVIFILALFLSYGFAHLLNCVIHIQNKWYFALIMVTTSVGIILPVLKSQNEQSTRFGQMVITAAAIADIFSIILFSFTAFILKQGFQAELLLIFVIFFVFYLMYFLGMKLTGKAWIKRMAYKLSHAVSQIQIRGTIFLILLFVVLAQFIGTEIMLLGAFLAGILISIFMNKSRSVLLIKLDGMGYGFFIPIFFIMVGVHFDEAALTEMSNALLPFLALLFVALYAIKILPALLWRHIFGTKKALGAGFLMASRLSLIIAASKIGLDFGIITPGMNAAFVLMAVVTCFVSPVLYNLISPNKILEGDKIIIVGGSSTGVLLARRMNMHGRKSIFVEQNQARCEEIRTKGMHVLHANGKEANTYHKLKLKQHNFVVIVTEDEQQNAEIAYMLKKQLGHSRIITKSSSATTERQLTGYQIEYIDATQLKATAIENLITRPATYRALLESFENFHIEDITILNRNISKSKIKDIPFHKDGELILIKRGADVNIPHGYTTLQTGDVVTVMGTQTALDDFRDKFAKN
ncbi:monovalent cation:proton antiporter family protein [Salinivirga cyanobacteriivorans]